ncbi:hypothetical protein [Photorhabdus tasmaniensis]|uniref:hypothetical protein n=1 Tax=Photorhabdus tasmaniensis TaxID=1004159 RepID=UPI001A989B75|nr:hypothetical protein [Photorhabdus tasmaniensis]
MSIHILSFHYEAVANVTLTNVARTAANVAALTAAAAVKISTSAISAAVTARVTRITTATSAIYSFLFSASRIRCHTVVPGSAP